MDIFVLYLFTRVDELRSVINYGAFLTLFATIITLLMWLFVLDEAPEMIKTCKRWFIGFLVFTTACMSLKVLVPSQKDIAIIVGGHYALQAAQSGTARKILELVEGKLDEEIERIKKPKK